RQEVRARLDPHQGGRAGAGRRRAALRGPARRGEATRLGEARARDRRRVASARGDFVKDRRRMTAPPQDETLRERLGTLADLAKVGALLAWDQQTIMPPRGAEVRAEQLGTIGRIFHEKLVSDELGTLLEELRPYEESLDRDSFDASLIRV